ncbi:MAG: hypothetical protein JXR72_05260, partial [Proteobacteria bacterium]|nr:hypothetical protein [Pseudomonadota bacterium]
EFFTFSPKNYFLFQLIVFKGFFQPLPQKKSLPGIFLSGYFTPAAIFRGLPTPESYETRAA